MSLLEKLTIKNLRLNKKRTIVTIIGIVLSVALITAVASMYVSGIKSLIKFEIREKGDFHFAFYDVPVENIEAFENNRKIEKISITKHIGYARLEDSQNEYKPYAHIMSFDENALKNLSVNLVEGRLPQSDDEIVIPTHLKTNGRMDLEVGQNITLEVGTRVMRGGDSSGEELSQYDYYIESDEEGAGEEIVNTKKKTYRIVGRIERPASNIEPYQAPGYTFITLMKDGDVSGEVDLYVRYTKAGLDDMYRITADIAGIDAVSIKFEMGGLIGEITEEEIDRYFDELDKANYEFEYNSYLIQLEKNPLESDITGKTGIVALIVCAIIIAASVFCIKNSFDISITEKIRQYGMLRSIGATKKQIRKNVFYEAFILGSIGIPLGVLLGFLASYILVMISNHFLGEMFTENVRLVFVFSWAAVGFSAVLGAVTVYLSAIRGAIRASGISPINAIRNSENIKVNGKKMKTPKPIYKIFGIGGDISYKSLKRNKRKYRTTVISIIVSTAVFISMASFVNLAFDEVKREFRVQSFNIEVAMHTWGEDSYNKLMETTKLEGIEECTVLRQEAATVYYPAYSDEYLKIYDLNRENYHDYLSEGYALICCIGEESYKNYVKKLGLNYEEVKDKAILIDYENIEAYDSSKKRGVNIRCREFSYKKGDVISAVPYYRIYWDGGDNDEEDNDIGNDVTGNHEEGVYEPRDAVQPTANKYEKLTIACVTEENPIGLSDYMGARIILSDEYFDTILDDSSSKEYGNVYYRTDRADKLQEEIEEILSGYDYYLNNSDEQVREMKNLITLVAIFLYGFIIVISLIGVTNIFNTITTNMELRRQEFAMLKSVGMTKREFSRMIRLESMFMGVKSMIFGIPIGLILSYLIYYYLTRYQEMPYSYKLPTMAIMISIIAVFLLITCIMRYSLNKINKQNTIETIRNENI